MFSKSRIAVCAGRFQPPSKIHYDLIAPLCENYAQVKVGITDKYERTKNNPFSYEERVDIFNSWGFDNLYTFHLSIDWPPPFHVIPWLFDIRKRTPMFSDYYTGVKLAKLGALLVPYKPRSWPSPDEHTSDVRKLFYEMLEDDYVIGDEWEKHMVGESLPLMRGFLEKDEIKEVMVNDNHEFFLSHWAKKALSGILDVKV